MTNFISKAAKEHKAWLIIAIISIIAIIALVVFSVFRFYSLNAKLAVLDSRILTLEDGFASKTAELENSIKNTHESLSEELEEERERLGRELGDYKEEIDEYTETVDTLQKLSQTDKELLQKYSKVFFLNEHYAPASLVEVPEKFKYSNDKHPQVLPEVWRRLEDLLEDALDDKVTIYVQSAFRSFNEQSALKGIYTVTYGAGTANAFSADQGYSEHQLGTTVDFIAPGLGGVLDDNFETTPAFAWLTKNAHKYGFVLSYPKNNPYYVYEPWHWRYVGKKLATDLYNDKKNFYDLEQREIDKYLIDLF